MTYVSISTDGEFITSNELSSLLRKYIVPTTESFRLLGGRQWGGRGGTFRTAHSILLLTYVGALT